MIHMLTGWVSYTINLKSSSVLQTWEALTSLLPLWKRQEDISSDNEESTNDEVFKDNSMEHEREEEKTRNMPIIIGTFHSGFPSSRVKPPTAAAVEEVVSALELLMNLFLGLTIF